eukprot:3945320-Lingulodinium_polyedra.AAC.1
MAYGMHGALSAEVLAPWRVPYSVWCIGVMVACGVWCVAYGTWWVVTVYGAWPGGFYSRMRC